MSKILKRSISLAMIMLMLMSSLSLSFSAIAVGQVKTIKATSTSSSVSLNWKKVSGAKGYYVYRYNSDSKKWKRIKETTLLKYTDESVSSGKQYTYALKAVERKNGKYATGKMSDSVKIVTKPGKVEGLIASNKTMSSVTLKWNKLSGVRGYAVYKYNTSTKKYTLIDRTLSNSFTVKNLKASTSYVFAVRAYVKYGSLVYGSYSSKLTVKTSQPSVSKVKNLRLVSVGSNSFKLQWDKVSGATGYSVCQYDSSNGKWVSVATTQKTYADIKVKSSSTNYKYSVRAYVKYSGKNYYGSYASSINAFAKPDVPKNLEGAENSNKGISLKWSAVSGASGYQVYSYDAVNGAWVLEGTTSKNSYEVKNLRETSHYKYKVRAYKTSNGTKFYGDFCESVMVAFNSGTTDSIYSEEMEKSGVLGYLYDPGGRYFYTADDPWQRNVGYNSVFDITAPLTLISFDTVRLRFEYGDKDWMIQLWKGQYGLIFYGAEVGVYTKPKDRVVKHYDCASDEDMLKMSMDFLEYKNGEWKKRFTRPYGYYWWCTGFIPGNKRGNFDVLGLDMRITAKDYTMLQGIKAALEENKLNYTVKGLDVYFSYR